VRVADARAGALSWLRGRVRCARRKGWRAERPQRRVAGRQAVGRAGEKGRETRAGPAEQWAEARKRREEEAAGLVPRLGQK